MEALFIYGLKTIICSGVLFGYYFLFLKDKTFHHYNRFYLLGSLLISLVLPLLKVDYFTVELNPNLYLFLQKFNINSETETHGLLYLQIGLAAIALVAIVFLARFFWGILKINQFKKKYPREISNGIYFYHTDLQNAPFSFFKNLFWKNSILPHSDLGQQILKHEMVHIEQKHSIDKILIEVLKSLFWFNPFFWLIKKELHLIHEYLADKKALLHNDTRAFAQMLLENHFAGNNLPAINPFLSSNLKKRLKMLQKSQTKYAYLRKILALPLLFAIGFIYLVNAKNKEIENTNKMVEKMVVDYLEATKIDTVKPLSKKIVEHRVVLKEDEQGKTIKDSVKRYVATAIYEETDGKISKETLFPNLKNASGEEQYQINGKSVSKKEFEEFIDSDLDGKGYSFVYINKSNIGEKPLFSVTKRKTIGETEKQIKELSERLKKVDDEMDTIGRKIEKRGKEMGLASAYRTIEFIDKKGLKIDKLEYSDDDFAKTKPKDKDEFAKKVRELLDGKNLKYLESKKGQKDLGTILNEYVNNQNRVKISEESSREDLIVNIGGLRNAKVNSVIFNDLEKNADWVEQLNQERIKVYINGKRIFSSDLDSISPDQIKRIRIEKDKIITVETK